MNLDHAGSVPRVDVDAACVDAEVARNPPFIEASPETASTHATPAHARSARDTQMAQPGELTSRPDALPTRRLACIDTCGEMFGVSPPIQEIFKQIRLIAPLDLTIMLEGESGTGKELAARAIHQLSGRSGPFVAFNCGAVASELLASQLFGHERGSFTGAVREHHGVFEQALHGTLFLDEVTEMPYPLQAHLLRVLESGTIRRVGASHDQSVDCRIVAATNCDSRRAVSEGRLREDLFYRLSDFPLHLPPLRERPGDVFALAQRFLERLNARHHTAYRLAPGSEAVLRAYAWPGNVRELKQVIQRAYLLCGSEPMQVDLPDDDGCRRGIGVRFQVGMTFDEIEQQMLRKTLLHFDNDKARAAAALGVSLKTIYNRLARCEFARNPTTNGATHLSID
jgi:DNA-binding NtrC family response regulator